MPVFVNTDLGRGFGQLFEKKEKRPLEKENLLTNIMGTPGRALSVKKKQNAAASKNPKAAFFTISVVKGFHRFHRDSCLKEVYISIHI